MKPIGYYCITNTAGISILKVDQDRMRVKISFNGETPEWAPMYEESKDDGEVEFGFKFGWLKIPFSEVMRA